MEVYVSTFAVAILGAAIYKYFTAKAEEMGNKPIGDNSTGFQSASSVLLCRDSCRCIGMVPLAAATSYDKVTGQPRGVVPPAYLCTTDTGATIVTYHMPEVGGLIGPQ